MGKNYYRIKEYESLRSNVQSSINYLNSAKRNVGNISNNINNNYKVNDDITVSSQKVLKMSNTIDGIKNELYSAINFIDNKINDLIREDEEEESNV